MRFSALPGSPVTSFSAPAPRFAGLKDLFAEQDGKDDQFQQASGVDPHEQPTVQMPAVQTPIARSGKRKAMRWIGALLGLGALATGGAGAAGYYRYTQVNLPKSPEAMAAQQKGVYKSSQVRAADGSMLLNRGRPATLAEVDDDFEMALIATEDKGFYHHPGISLRGMARAMLAIAMSHGEDVQGGSTLTQQFVKNVYLTNERSLSRKEKEAILALKLERKYSKDEILSLYINSVDYGPNITGVRNASFYYFGKPPKELTMAEAALLAGLPNKPVGYDPFLYPKEAKERRNLVLGQVIEHLDSLIAEADHQRDAGQISQKEAKTIKAELEAKRAEAEAAKNEPVPTKQPPNNQMVNRVPTFDARAVQEAMDVVHKDRESFMEAGYTVKTSLRPDVEAKAIDAMQTVNNEHGRTGADDQGALVSTDSDGHILAYVGNINSGNEVDHVQAGRMAGSTMKMLVYGLAFENKIEVNGQPITPYTVIEDPPGPINGYDVHNYENEPPRNMTVREAFITSNNRIAIRIANLVGIENLQKKAKELGIASAQEDKPWDISAAIGSVNVTPEEMAGVLGSFGNGTYKKPTALLEIRDKDGKPVDLPKREATRVWREDTAQSLTRLMRENVVHGTARNANIGPGVAGKTGTSESHTDAWLAARTPEVNTVVWHGESSGKAMADSITGGGYSALAWARFMKGWDSGFTKPFDFSQALPLVAPPPPKPEEPKKSETPTPSATSPTPDQPTPTPTAPAPTPTPTPPAPTPTPTAPSPAPTDSTTEPAPSTTAPTTTAPATPDQTQTTTDPDQQPPATEPASG